MKRLKYISCALALLAISCAKPANPDFENKLFLDCTDMQMKIKVDYDEDNITERRTLFVKAALPATQDIHAVLHADPAYLQLYKELYHNEEAVALPVENCRIASPEVKMETGLNISNGVEITFVDLNLLDRKKTYVMPVALENVEGMDVLESKRVMFFVFQEAALVNVVADMSQNKMEVDWIKPNELHDQLTIEALINVRDFSYCDGAKIEEISTIFGIENVFLLRIGDAGFPSNQVQLVVNKEKFPAADFALGLPMNEWVHVAVVWDAVTKERILYYNGMEVAKDDGAHGTVCFADGPTFIGESFKDSRWLEGYMSELRVWDSHRTEEEIRDNMYRVSPESEHLIAYWKFSEGEGNIIKDFSSNGQDVVSTKPMKWFPVSLPLK